MIHEIDIPKVLHRDHKKVEWGWGEKKQKMKENRRYISYHMVPCGLKKK